MFEMLSQMTVFDFAIDLSGDLDLDVAAGGHGSLIAVADGLGGHRTGWLASRLAIRTLVGAPPARFVGGAAELPETWGWAGATQSRSAALEIYEACERLLGSMPADLATALAELDRTIARIPELPYRLTGPMTGCTVASLVGTRLQVAHAGIGRALLVRGGVVESLVEQHLMRHVVGEVVAGALGMRAGQFGIDTVERDVAVGDVIVLSSRRLELSDEALAALVKPPARADELIDRIVRVAHASRTTALAVGVVC